ncbi:MAG: DEAD/DEAH box helicase family protein [Streptococcaceae bacterium]|nr:DEAD/DEAH box helicase family protein [Streptococcaceae bacterium]
MPHLNINERYDFQQWIIKDLVELNGFEQRHQSKYETRFAMDTEILWDFLQVTQPKIIEKLFKKVSREQIFVMINQEILKNGLLFSLKSGVYIENEKLELMFAQPATTFNEKANLLFQAQRFTVMEEVNYEGQDRIDLVLFLNGLALFAVELKLNSSGQTVQDAMRQFKQDRNPKNRLFQFNAGVLVSFAVDTQEVYMTTELKKSDTYFLPFNQGAGVGKEQGKGNPQKPDGVDTVYLWREVFTKSSIIQLIERFIFLETDKKKKRLIFPRYQQRRVVKRVTEDMRVNHTENNYLIQHSAGSGKTNTIAWLAHSLVSLHDKENMPVVDTVLIVTDRIVVDRQLQDAVMGMSHQSGLIRVMDDKATSADLADAIFGNTKIIATTIHKFFQIQKNNLLMQTTKNKHFAILIDEAHSSTTGTYMSAVSQVLTETDLEDGTDEEIQEVSVSDAIEREIERTGKQDNISIIAFTATPKATTLQLFGKTKADGIGKEPFDVYSMKQAIEEGFILDVLSNYVTYETYYKLNKAVEEDPAFKSMVAKRKIAKFIELSDENIDGKVDIIMDHFITHDVMAELGGHGKAMIVTSGREAAVKYQKSFHRYLKEHSITSIGMLVAFSGKVDFEGKEYTERSINGLSEEKLKEKFDTDDFQVLIVANKYQTGFDQPKLVAMYVDKKLRNVAAVQTLSRLNRIVTGYNKKTFVLDFKNTYEEINKAFAPYYTETTLAETISPSDILALDAKIETLNILDMEIVHEFNQYLYQEKRLAREKQKMEALLNVGVKRVKNYSEKEQLEIQKAMRAFIRLYTFLIQATAYQNEVLHEKYNYMQALVKMIDIRLGGNDFTIADKIVVNYMKHKFTGDFHVAELEGEYAVKLNKPTLSEITEDQEKKLSEIISEMNEQLGSAIDDSVGVTGAITIRELLKKNEKLKQSAKVNSRDDFKFAFDRQIDEALTAGFMQNQDFFGALLNNEQFKKRVAQMFVDDVYNSFK